MESSLLEVCFLPLLGEEYLKAGFSHLLRLFGFDRPIAMSFTCDLTLATCTLILPWDTYFWPFSWRCSCHFLLRSPLLCIGFGTGLSLLLWCFFLRSVGRCNNESRIVYEKQRGLSFPPKGLCHRLSMASGRVKQIPSTLS